MSNQNFRTHLKAKKVFSNLSGQNHLLSSFAGGLIDIASTCSGKVTAEGAVVVGQNVRPTFDVGIKAEIGPKGPSIGGSISVKTQWKGNDNEDDTFRGNNVGVVNKSVVIVSVVSKVAIDLLIYASLFDPDWVSTDNF